VMKIPIEAFHRFGPVDYQNHITVDGRLRSTVKDREGFEMLLEAMKRQSHHFHELFLSDKYLKRN